MLRGKTRRFCAIENLSVIRHCVVVNLKFHFAPLLAVALFVGCSKPVPPLTKAAPIANDLPTQAQPKLKMMKLYVGPEIVDAELALTEYEIHCGMMFRTNIQETDAMLFNLRYPQRANFWMTNCPGINFRRLYCSRRHHPGHSPSGSERTPTAWCPFGD